jgi:REP element-mobilizing transposase RayT
MSLPRQVLPGEFYLVTRRCTQRQFLLRPDAETNNAFTYCLVEAAKRTMVEVLMSCAMSNHHHTVIYDRCGRYPEFIEHFHKIFARSQNALRRRRENLWSSGQASVVRLVDREDVMAKLVYTAINPVKDHLVDRVHHWPGVNTLHALLRGRPLQAKRPLHFFRRHGNTPAVVEMPLVIPTELGPEADILDELQRRVAEAEATLDLDRQSAGKRVVGRRAVLQQSWRSAPVSDEPHGTLRPRVAARSQWSRIEALQRNRAFERDYAIARRAWIEGIEASFPPGTYWLRRFAGVPLSAA